MIYELIRKARIYEFLRFGVSGLLSFVIDYSILVLLTDEFKIYYLTSSSISFLISVIFNYFICVKWVFKGSKKQTLMSVLIFIIISLIGLLLNQLLMWFSVEILLVSYKLAKIIATLLVIIWNYFMKRKAIMI